MARAAAAAARGAAARRRPADGLLSLLTDAVDAELIGAASGLRAISNYAVGVDNVDLGAATARGIPVGNTPGVLTESTADLALALMLALMRRLPEGQAAVRAGEWLTWEPDWLLGRDLHRSTVAVIGPGRIGSAVARRVEGFGAQVVTVGRGEPLEPALGSADVVSAARAPHRRHPRADRRERPAGDEARRLPGEHRARPDRRPGRAGARAARGLDRRRGAGRDRPGAAAGRPSAARGARTCWWCRTSRRPPTPRARRWPTWPWTTCWRGWPGAMPHCANPRSTGSAHAAIGAGTPQCTSWEAWPPTRPAP